MRAPRPPHQPRRQVAPRRQLLTQGCGRTTRSAWTLAKTLSVGSGPCAAWRLKPGPSWSLTPSLWLRERITLSELFNLDWSLWLKLRTSNPDLKK